MTTLALITTFIFLAFVGNLFAAQIPNEDRAVMAAENIGLEKAHVVRRQPAFEVLGGCKQQDVTKFTVVGIDIQGRKHTIQVCAPLFFGGYTIRS